MLRTYRLKLYLTNAQRQTLHSWLGSCCWLYNQDLERRRKIYHETGQRPTLYDQFSWLTALRKTDARLAQVPVEIARSPLYRLNRALQGYFRRRAAGEQAGYPRFRQRGRYVSMECTHPGKYVSAGGVRIPGMGRVRARGYWQAGPQKQLRLIYVAGSWYADVLVELSTQSGVTGVTAASVGVDLGLTTLATLSTGESFENRRWCVRDKRQRRRAHKKLSRAKTGSNNWQKALRKLQRLGALIADRRRNYLHKFTTDLVRKYGLIALEDLDIAAMTHSRFGKSIFDAGWGIFKWQLTYKAECAGTRLVFVDPNYTSQTCPECGAVKAKEIHERVHACPCGCRLDRDVAAARVILDRARAAELAAA